ncbi:uncharacterized protein LOC108158998 isoform X1 [Drosophila miranda]|uniref:uncharacterized protein LOC108158998 isoform X1 n=2 Tax=Drosophila miranda TaxID=7229 RepID=UPI0007E8A352|nr:uncharacterized protein LOC108158998 isoform X1 [Drosophila miranda]
MDGSQILLLLLLCAMGRGVRSDCRIAQYMVEGTNRIFTYRDASGAFRLQRTETVPAGVTLCMFCTVTDWVETQCQDNGQFSVAMPMTCNEPMRPTITRIRDNECSGTMYAVGYTIEGQQLELYRTCFDASNARVLYSQSDVYYKSFFPRRPWVEFVADELFSPREATAYLKSNIYHAFNYIYGNGQTYLTSARSLVINRGHLVASADFLFVDQMSSTFRYLNVVPQFKSINDGNWEKIERWVRSIVPQSTPFRVKTGGIGILMLADTRGVFQQAYLAGAKIPVPEWTYKVVREVGGRGLYVFLTYNCTFQRERPQVLNICSPVSCPLSLPNTPHDGFTFCCDPKQFPL